MKTFMLCSLSLATVCSGSELVHTVDLDFKRPDARFEKRISELRTELDLSNAEDQAFLERCEQDMYADAMLEVLGPPVPVRCIKLRRGDSWRAVWSKQLDSALKELGEGSDRQQSLRSALEKLSAFLDEHEARLLDRVVLARFGGEPVWIISVKWEWEEAVAQILDSEGEAALGHFLVVAIRISDQKVVSRAKCG